MRISDWSSDVCSSDLGGVLRGTTCVVTQPAAVSSYSCPPGFSLQGTTCTPTTTEPAVITGSSCPADYILEGDGCVRTIQQSATPNYTCTTGYVLDGTTCRSKSDRKSTRLNSSPECASRMPYSA